MSEIARRPPSPELRTIDKLRAVLNDMVAAGEFEAAVLMSADSLPIAACPPEQPGDQLGMLVSFLRRVCIEAEKQVDLAQIEEVTMRDASHTQLVYRRLRPDAHSPTLTVVVPAGRPYRRAMNRALRRLKRWVD
ncbi:MAG: hypothetical protein JXD18_10890 [Anaerolineae bacterium]|nr:hypothetical protein [Anaerolineae bacterium]